MRDAIDHRPDTTRRRARIAANSRNDAPRDRIGTRGAATRARASAGSPGRRSHWCAPRGADARGTTLIETLVVVGIVSVLLSAAVPGFRSFIARHRVVAATGDFVHAIATTRSEALRRGRRVYLAPLDGHWRNGWAIFVDRNDDRQYDGPNQPQPDERIALHDALPASVDVANSSGSAHEPFSDGMSPRRPYLMFDGGGYSRQRNGALHFGGIVLADRSGGRATVRTVCLGSYGRVRVVADRAGC